MKGLVSKETVAVAVSVGQWNRKIWYQVHKGEMSIVKKMFQALALNLWLPWGGLPYGTDGYGCRKFWI